MYWLDLLINVLEHEVCKRELLLAIYNLMGL